jgi:cell division protein FtsI (penicillin-binding protein 3)
MRGRNHFSRRLFIVGLACTAGAVAIAGRMYWLSIVEGPEMARQVKTITCGESVKMSYRGPIVDRNGSALATSIAASRVALRRADYRYTPGDGHRLAPLLGADADELERTLRDDPSKFIWLSHSVDPDAANAIRQLRIAGIDVHRDQQRSYPHGPLAAHVVGFTGVDAQGLEGVERMLDAEIRGRAVSVRVCTDVRGRVFLDEGDKEEVGANRGATVQLTLDLTLQSIAEAELRKQVAATRAAGGAVVMLDPRTGEVLAMANVPDFDPNVYGRSPVSYRRNRTITDIFEPGSTMKPFLIAGALDAGVIDETDRFFCEHGAMRVGGWTIHDHHPYDYLTVPEIIQVSSNICSAKVGAELGAERFYKYLKAFGFARKSGIGLPGDNDGMLTPPEKWRPIHVANISFGQGIGVTAIQLASAFATLANDGVRMKPYIVQRVTDRDGVVVERNEPVEEGRVVRREVARSVTSMLEAVVSPGGTAPRAHVQGIRVAGKTGTAQKAENGRYSHDRWLASFAGYLPADDPRLVIAVTIDEPKTNHFGGMVAAPVFRAIAEASLDYLHIYRAPQLDEQVVTIEAKLPTPAERQPASFDGTMPDLTGLSLRSAMQAIHGCNCDVDVEGRGYVVAQEPAPGVVVPATVQLKLARAGGS